MNKKKDYSKMVVDFTTMPVSATRLREDIDSVVSSEEIFSHYLPDFKPGKPMISPLRPDDDRPSFNVYPLMHGGGEYMYKDFGNGDAGDAYTFVQKLFGVKFSDALKIIASDLKVSDRLKYVGFTPNLDMTYGYNKITKSRQKESSVNETIKVPIIIEPQPYTVTDIAFWSSFGISVQTLHNYNVQSVSRFWINNLATQPHVYTKEHPIYAYKFGKTPLVDLRYKIYSPYRPKGEKWLNNCNSRNVQGLDQLKFKGYFLIITKAMKDVMTLRELGFNAVAPQSESTLIPEDINSDLQTRFKEHMVLFDHDDGGIMGANRIVARDPLTYSAFIKDPKAKDISDYVRQYGKHEGKRLITFLFQQVSGLDWKYEEINDEATF